MIYDELIGEVQCVIGRTHSDPELKEELRQLNFDIHKNVVRATGDSYIMDKGTNIRIELNQVIKRLGRVVCPVRESDTR